MKVLIPLDGSPTGESALLAMLPLIQTADIDSTLMRVVEPQAPRAVESYLEAHAQALQARGVHARTIHRTGAPAEEIVKEAVQGHYDLVAMGTHGRSGIQRVLMGSVAEEVVRSSPVPTLLCKSGARIGDWDRFVVALDGTVESQEILNDVTRLARLVGAEVHLVRVGLPLLTCDGYRGSCFTFPAQDPLPYLQGIAEQLRAQGISCVVERREGIASVEITLLALHLDAGLICMMTEGRPERVPGLDRSVAAEVIRSSPCPVYVRRMVRAAAATRSD